MKINMKKIARFFLLNLLIASAAFAQLSQKKMDDYHLPWIKFNWKGEILSDRYFDKVAMTIPVKIDDLPYNFNAQLDLGAVNTMFYGKPIAPYLQLFPDLNNKLDTSRKAVYIEGRACPLFHHINLTLDQVSFPGISVAHFSDYGGFMPVDSAKTLSSKHIGTIAPDLFQNKILLIDYPNQRICVINDLPLLMEKEASFVPVKIENGRMKIPFTIGKKEVDIMFDTGSSIFSIVASPENAAIFTDANQSVTDSISGNNWGQTITAYGKKMTKEIKIGKYKMPPALVYYTPKRGLKAFEDREKITGLTGNAWFLNNIVIVDYKRKRFGML